jgi:PleD family two-component response regulator
MLNPTEIGTRENEARDVLQGMHTPIRVLIVDDHAILRAGVREMLAEEQDLQVVAEAGSAEDALQHCVMACRLKSSCSTSRCRARAASICSSS